MVFESEFEVRVRMSGALLADKAASMLPVSTAKCALSHVLATSEAVGLAPVACLDTLDTQNFTKAVVDFTKAATSSTVTEVGCPCQVAAQCCLLISLLIRNRSPQAEVEQESAEQQVSSIAGAHQLAQKVSAGHVVTIQQLTVSWQSVNSRASRHNKSGLILGAA